MSIPATSFTVNNASTITATAPAGSGSVDVQVTTPGGTSATSANDQFTYSAGSPPGVIPSPTAGGWQLNGSSTLVSSASPPNLQLTAATANEAGSAFWPTPVPGVGISAAFDASIGSGTGADGLTFTLADASATTPTALGSSGGGEGYAGLKGIAVSLDTYKNSVNPSSNFVGIATGQGSTAGTLQYATTNSSIPSLRNTVHHFVVTTFSTGLTVTMDGSQVLTYATSLPPTVLVGFTGGTGGLTDIHAVQNVSITAGSPPPSPTVTGVSPNTGPSTGGTPVTVSGTNLTGASEVDFGRTRGVDLHGQQRHLHHHDGPARIRHGRHHGRRCGRDQPHQRQRPVRLHGRDARADGDLSRGSCPQRLLPVRDGPHGRQRREPQGALDRQRGR